MPLRRVAQVLLCAAALRGQGLPIRVDLEGWQARADAPQYLSIKVPDEGNYRVTVTLGDPEAASVTTVKAELRRLMLENIRVPAGKSETRTFVVNVRRPQIAGGGEVRLKPREKESEAWAWDDRLTFEF